VRRAISDIKAQTDKRAVIVDKRLLWQMGQNDFQKMQVKSLDALRQ
jgi:hypothetical protein